MQVVQCRKRLNCRYLSLVGLLCVGCDSRSAVPTTVAVTKPPTRTEKTLLSDSEILGSYYFGDGLGVNCSLTLAKDHTFTFQWHGCLGEYDRNGGPWHREKDLVVLEPTRPNRHDGFEGMDTRFVPVRLPFGSFLVKENSMPAFAADARKHPNGHKDVHYYDEYVRLASKTGGAADKGGKLAMPSEYLEYYDKGPILAKVLEINQDGTVKLAKNKDGRLRPKLRLTLEVLSGIEIEVLTVGPTSAVARVDYVMYPNRAVKVGDEFSTGCGPFVAVQPDYVKRYASPSEAKKAARNPNQ